MREAEQYNLSRTWQDRFIDWLRDLGFLQKPRVETKAARDTSLFLQQAEQ